MASQKCVGPAHPGEDDGEARRDLLGSSSSNTPSLDQPQAPDNTGENDELFFQRRPGARQRLRLPFPGEFSAAILSEARIQARGGEVLVLVVTDRDASGIPSTRARGLVCLPGGRA